MAELGFTRPSSTASSATGDITVDKLSLVRTGATFSANTSLDINSPGVGWASVGGPVFFSSAGFIESTQVYRNGILQMMGADSSADNDVYFVSASGTLAFEHAIGNLDVVQVYNYTASGGG